MEPIQIAMIFILIISVVLHEMAHGYAANWLGDPTARLAGRLTANPLVHIDPLGSVILPALLIIGNSMVPGSGGFIFGWAKPVPYNPYNLTNQKWGEAIVAAAGPGANIAIAIIFAILIRSAEVLQLSSSFIELSINVIILNIFLAFFNLVPIPPLDGSKILPRLLPYSLAMKYEEVRRTLEQNSGVAFIIVIMMFIFVLAEPLYKLTFWITQTLIGF